MTGKVILRLISAVLLTLIVAVTPVLAQTGPAAKPMYRDPVHDGAADPAIVFDEGAKLWRMFYTNRRADVKYPSIEDVSWVHGTHIGVATSKDGLHWSYDGIANIPEHCTGPTLWAPDIIFTRGEYHMYLTVVNGVFKAWGDPAAKPRIVHLTSRDLKSWACQGEPDLGSSTVIDVSTLEMSPGTYRMWYKDMKEGRIYSAKSDDLKSWVRDDKPAFAGRGEGPKVIRLDGIYWMLIDSWKGLSIQRSEDGVNWEWQPDRILEMPGIYPTDREKGQHADVVVSREADGTERALIYYFVHQGQEDAAKTDPYWQHRTVLQVAELRVVNEHMSVDRNAAVTQGLASGR
ncbi:glycoside hydrolase family 43 [Asticcacaulis machinosus]|uniref:Glycoside hydrolase family 43 n=1 Tax=Asticcacaulis machinosus TaxID=2984211 RepID=A0ABT5HML3_9CAUL|nr:glycoside hydrolase family 43 [Asticcacaulis machinosus]MDC7677493.1 glycoside hydrolase family 43 [Asticcacaulis machinosus]